MKTSNDRKIYIDLSIVQMNKARSGIDNVAKDIFDELRLNYDIKTVRFDGNAFEEFHFLEKVLPGHKYVASNRKFTKRRLLKEIIKSRLPGRILFLVGVLKYYEGVLRTGGKNSNEINFSKNDILVVPEVPQNRKHQSSIANLQKDGVKTFILVHDLIPVQKEVYTPYQITYAFKKFLKLIPNASRIITPSLFTKDQLVSYLHNQYSGSQTCRKIHVIQPRPREFVNPTGFCSKLEFSGPKILYVSSIIKRKNQLVVLKIFDQVAQKEFSRLNLVFVAPTGDLINLLMWKISRLKNRNLKTDLYLNVPECCLSQIYNDVDVAVYLSSQEGFGLPVADAISIDLPVIVLDIPVLREFKESKNVYYIPSLDKSNLEKALHLALKYSRSDTEVKRAQRPDSWSDLINLEDYMSKTAN